MAAMPLLAPQKGPVAAKGFRNGRGIAFTSGVFGLEPQQAILFIPRNTCSNRIAKPFRA